jgi:hypothetical protein
MSLTSTYTTMNRIYTTIHREFQQYENIRFLKGMVVKNQEYFGDELNESYYMEVKKGRGMAALMELVRYLVPEWRAQEVFDYIWFEYYKEWDRFERDLATGKISKNTMGYKNYSWRAHGPKLYFEGLIEGYLKRYPKNFRSIDDL